MLPVVRPHLTGSTSDKLERQSRIMDKLNLPLGRYFKQFSTNCRCHRERCTYLIGVKKFLNTRIAINSCKYCCKRVWIPHVCASSYKWLFTSFIVTCFFWSHVCIIIPLSLLKSGRVEWTEILFQIHTAVSVYRLSPKAVHVTLYNHILNEHLLLSGFEDELTDIYLHWYTFG